MGVIMTNYCKNDFTNTEFLTSSTNLSNKSFNDENIIKKIPQINNANEGIDYITSKDCYQILIRKVPKIILVKKLCQNLESQEIFSFIKHSINWILPARAEKIAQAHRRTVRRNS